MSSEQPLPSESPLAVVRASPAAVAAHDKAAWLGLFATDAEINDPVGSRPHVGPAARERFYETFIAPNDVHFRVDRDVVDGSTVMRDVVIEIRMATGLLVEVPAHIRYRLVSEAGALRIGLLHAHWELAAMVAGTLRAGVAGLRAYAALGRRMLACQGLGGMLGFSRGFLGVGRRGKRRAGAFLAAVARGDGDGARRSLAGEVMLALPGGTPATVEELAQRLHDLEWSKMIAAGRTVTASVALPDARGVVVLVFGRHGRIARADFYLADAD